MLLSHILKRKLLLIACLVCCSSLGFSLYVHSLYLQVKLAFLNEAPCHSTRIYSDITVIDQSKSRIFIEKKLSTLGYFWDTPSSHQIKFQIHPRNYPEILLPSNAPLPESPTVLLTFKEEGAQALLDEIEANEQHFDVLYLEPELIATLTPSQSLSLLSHLKTQVKFHEIPSLIWKAIIAIEDQHFLDHKGLDPQGIARALWINLKTLSWAQGGSTLTQQLVKNLIARRNKNIFSKFNELFLSLLLEANFQKQKILERYLNEVYLGQIGSLEVHGIVEGAQHFFGKKIIDLNLAEITLLTGLIRGPSYYSPYRHPERAFQRQRLILNKMVETGQIAKDEAEAALQTKIHFIPEKTSTNQAPFFVDQVKSQLLEVLSEQLSETELVRAGLKVYTTLDPELNTLAQQSVSQGIFKTTSSPSKTNQQLEGALACIDLKQPGLIRALIGGKDYSHSSFNRILHMKRPVGSIFKPFVYLSAFQKGYSPEGTPYSPAYPMKDFPWTWVFHQGKKSWTPNNYPPHYRGWTSLRTALAHSINTVTAQLGKEVGLESILQTVKALGIHATLPEVPALVLGVADLSPKELLQAYLTISQRGKSYSLSSLRAVTQGEQLLWSFSDPLMKVAPEDQGPFDLLTDLMQSVFLEGSAHLVALQKGWDRPAAGKTGTTSQHRDAWFIGYTPQLLTVVWVGADQQHSTSSSSQNLTGSRSALPIWISFMQKALEFEPNIPFHPSPFLRPLYLDRYTGEEATEECPRTQVILEKTLLSAPPQRKTCATAWLERSSP